MIGLDALLGLERWEAGLGYDHTFAGSSRVDGSGGAFSDTNRTLDTLWALGRFYPWQNNNVAIYLQLGVGAAWQGVGLSGEESAVSGGELMLIPSACSGHGSLGLGLRGAVGVDVAVSSSIIFYGEIGVDHFRLSDQELDECAAGMGASTFLLTRFGFAFAMGATRATGHIKKQ